MRRTQNKLTNYLIIIHFHIYLLQYTSLYSLLFPPILHAKENCPLIFIRIPPQTFKFTIIHFAILGLHVLNQKHWLLIGKLCFLNNSIIEKLIINMVLFCSFSMMIDYGANKFPIFPCCNHIYQIRRHLFSFQLTNIFVSEIKHSKSILFMQSFKQIFWSLQSFTKERLQWVTSLRHHKFQMLL